ncbi:MULTISPECIES: polynucleotide adenylyltransferase [Chromohalobacter]|uniref:Polynucleotide adenylyltransferase n=2 Tax=Chromohalobacter TaxID=42054 RepID=A0A9X2X0J3_9GAMM|nr:MULTISPECIES: polynucleotide adenylyltransferase [Chromohalobacter]MCK0768432.1 polynucleotide adenylyltransferase [Chromohalobacter canadensis]MCK2044413.1 polynucleotide adenylyltransferase [Chromohalobacter moromii]MCT8467394.1 polynucleotide adenylyltransferase [Chromohalobacter canadensis]MCT8470858.1 polynucleotide adenylyltransferase [Chromohalobacter canadensis]MCT8497891.1 polynucleotide adenylyltransferase [Chromohalobacter canadensis]
MNEPRDVLESFAVYRVGGAVRDARLGWPVTDEDWVVVGATPEELTERGFMPVGRDFPVFLHPVTHEEYALARTERKQGHGYTGFVVHASPEVTLEEDLARRDLTINAMAEDRDGRLVDPFQGAQDLDARVLRHVSEAFVEDPLRVLRTARFWARYRDLGFVIADDTKRLMRRLCDSGEIGHLVAERVWQETVKALAEPRPIAYFRALQECGALAVWMPELNADAALDLGEKAMARLPAGGEPAQWRWARLLEALEDEARDALCERLRVPNAWRDLARQVARTRAFRQKHDDAGLEGADVLAWFDAIDAWRRSERVEPLQRYLALEAPALAECISKAWQAAIEVEPRALLEEGYRGKALGEALAQRRLASIEDVVRLYKL